MAEQGLQYRAGGARRSVAGTVAAAARVAGPLALPARRPAPRRRTGVDSDASPRDQCRQALHGSPDDSRARGRHLSNGPALRWNPRSWCEPADSRILAIGCYSFLGRPPAWWTARPGYGSSSRTRSADRAGTSWRSPCARDAQPRAGGVRAVQRSSPVLPAGHVRRGAMAGHGGDLRPVQPGLHLRRPRTSTWRPVADDRHCLQYRGPGGRFRDRSADRDGCGPILTVCSCSTASQGTQWSRWYQRSGDTVWSRGAGTWDRTQLASGAGLQWNLRPSRRPRGNLIRCRRLWPDGPHSR